MLIAGDEEEEEEEVGTDTFTLFDPRKLNTIFPTGRIGSTSDGAGLVQDFDVREQEGSSRRIEFHNFEHAIVDLAATNAIFSVQDTATPKTTIKSGTGDVVVNIHKLTNKTEVKLGPGNDSVNIQGGGRDEANAPLLSVDGGDDCSDVPGNEKCLDLPDGGDRLRFGSTRAFESGVVNVADAPNAVKIFGSGWEAGQELLFTSDGIPPAPLVPGTIYYAVPQGREVIRLARTHAEAISATPNFIELADKGEGTHQLTATVDGKPKWPTTVGSLTGSEAAPVLSYTEPGGEQQIESIISNSVTTAEPHGFLEGQQVAFFAEADLPSGLKREVFYYVKSPTSTSFKLSKLKDGSDEAIQNVLPGSNPLFVAAINRVGLTGFEKMNVSLGLGNDTFVVDNSIESLGIELRGGPGNDDFALFQVPGKDTVIRGDSGNDDQLRLIVGGDPSPNQFKALTISEGIERVTVDDADNTQPVDWIISQGSVYFVTGRGYQVAVENAATLSYLPDNQLGQRPLQDGDRILLTSLDAEGKPGVLPSYVADNNGATLDPGQFYYVANVTDSAFSLSLSPAGSTTLNLTTFGSGAISFRRADILGSLEGAETSEILAGRGNVNTLSVVSAVDATVDITGNHLQILEGSRVLDHESNLQRGSFPVGRLDGLQGVRSVVAMQTYPFVFAAGTLDPADETRPNVNIGEIAMFVREAADNEEGSQLRWKGVKNASDFVPSKPSVLKLSPDEKFLYVVGEDKISVFTIENTNGAPNLKIVDQYDKAKVWTLVKSANLRLSLSSDATFNRPSDLEFSPDGRQVYVTDQGREFGDDNSESDGILVFERNVQDGRLTQVIQKLRKENSFGKSIDVGHEVIDRPETDQLSSGEFTILDEPFTNEITNRGVYQFYATRKSTITPFLFRVTNDDDHTQPGSLLFTLAATGKTRTIEKLGFNEFEFDSDVAIKESGLYFGWRDSGENGALTVPYTESTSSNVHQFVNGGDTFNYRAGRAYSMDANFEVADSRVLGLDNPQTIAVSPDGDRLFTGDENGEIATWSSLPQGRCLQTVTFAATCFQLSTNEAWYEETGAGLNPAGISPDLSFSAGRSLRVAADSSVGPSVTGPTGQVYGRKTASRPTAYADDIKFEARMTTPVVLTAKRPRSAYKEGVRQEGNKTNRGPQKTQTQQITSGANGVVRWTVADGFYRYVDSDGLFIDFDGEIASLASNGQFLMAGLPASDRFHGQTSPPDDVGAVVIFNVFSGGALDVKQVLTASTDLSNSEYSGFGASIAIDGNTAVISAKKSGSDVIQVWNYDGNRWNRTAELDGGFLVDIDRDTIITAREDSAANTGVFIYRRNTNGIWLRQTFRSGTRADLIGVSIDGNIASIVDANGFLDIYREFADGWVWQQAITTQATHSIESVREEGSDPILVDVAFTHVVVKSNDDPEGNNYYLWECNNGCLDHEEYRHRDNQADGGDGISNLNPPIKADFQKEIPVINIGQAEKWQVWEADGRADDFVGEFTFGNGWGDDARATEGISIKANSNVLNGNGSVDVYYDVTYRPDNDVNVAPVTTDIVDSLGDTIAIGVAGQNRVSIFAESEQQSRRFGGGATGGKITDIAVSPDGTTIYATDFSGQVFALSSLTNQCAALNCLPLTGQTLGASDANLAGASSVTVSADTRFVYVTAEISDEVTVFTRQSNNELVDGTSSKGEPGMAGVADSATEPAFLGQQFVVTAGSENSIDGNSLVVFKVNADGTFTARQRRDDRSGAGLGDGDNLNVVNRVQSLTMNPVNNGVLDVQSFYGVDPIASALYVINRHADGSQTVVPQSLRDGEVDRESNTGKPNVLGGAAAVAVSPDGRFVYVAATREGESGQIAIYERATLSKDDGQQFDGLKYTGIAINTDTFDVTGDNVTGDNPFANLTISPDGSLLVVSGGNGMRAFVLRPSDGRLTSVFSLLPYKVSDIKFLGDSRVYAAQPSTESEAGKLLIFSRDSNGLLVLIREEETLLEDPRSVEIGPAILGSPGIPEGRFIYVASAGNGSISVFDEFSEDGSDDSDKLIDGRLHHQQTIWEGDAGVRGLQGVHVLQMSAAIDDTVLSLGTAEFDRESRTINTDGPHGLTMGQKVAFEIGDEAPSGATPGQDYFVRKLDKDSFQLYRTERAARGHANLAVAEFDGIDDFVQVPSSSKLEPTEKLSVEAWINPAKSSERFDPVLTKSENGGLSNGYGMYYDSGRLHFFAGGFGQEVSAPISTGKFSHVVGTYDGTHLRLYIDGQVSAAPTPANEPIFHGGDLLIGSDPEPFHWQGSIGEVAIYGSELSASQVARHYDNLMSVGESGALADAPIVYYPLDEVEGNVAIDRSPNRLNGTYQNGVKLPLSFEPVEIFVGGVVEFDGIDDFVEVPPSSLLEPVGQLSVEAWINPVEDIINFAPVLTKTGDQSWSDGYGLYYNDNSIHFFVGGFEQRVSAPISRGTFSHVVGTYDGTTLQLYVDGETFQAPVTASQPMNHAGDLHIGRDPEGGDPEGAIFWQGSIGEVAIYESVLSATQVAGHYDNLLALEESGALDDSPIVYYRLNERQGSIAKDSSSNSINGVFRNSSSLAPIIDYALHTSIPAGAFLYALGHESNAIAVFQRDVDHESPTVGQLSFLQQIRNRVGNETSGANFGLFQPDSIIAPTDDTSSVFVGSAFDSLLGDAPGGFVSLHNNPHDSPSLPPIELNVEFANISFLTVTTGAGDDYITVLEAPSSPSEPAVGNNPNVQAAATDRAIPVQYYTGSGADSVTLYDAANVTKVNLGAGSDEFTIRTTDRPAEISLDTGDDKDKIVVGMTATDTQLTISGSQLNSVADVVRFVTPESQLGVRLTDGRIEVEGFGEIADSQGGQPTELGTVSIERKLIAQARVAPLGTTQYQDSITITEGSGIRLAAGLSCDDLTQDCTYSWDLNRDGQFTELVTSQEFVDVSWTDLLASVVTDGGIFGSVTRRVPLRVERVITNPDGSVQTLESDDEVVIVIQDAVSKLNLAGSSSFTAGLNSQRYLLGLSATSSNNEQIDSWTVNWGDGESQAYAGTNSAPSHFYQSPGSYNINVTALDDDGNQSEAAKTVNVAFNETAVNAGADYTTSEGQGITLSGAVLGAPDSLTWIVNGRRLPGGTTMNLSWVDLNAIGINNDGEFDVQLEATYTNSQNNSVVLPSSIASLTVENLAPEAWLINNGPINQGASAVVQYVDISEPNANDTLTFEYNFGNGFIPGTASQPVPSLPAGEHVIEARISDGTDSKTYTTTLTVIDLPPELNFNDSEAQLVRIDEGGETGSVSGTYHNPGNGPVTFDASLGSVNDHADGTWTWSHSTDDGSSETQQVIITLTDEDKATSQVDFGLVVSNIAPSATFSMPSEVNEGDGVSLAFRDVTDPSDTDTNEGFTYFYNFVDGLVDTESVDGLIGVVRSLPGDIDLNGTVGFGDFLVLSANFGKLGQSLKGDFDDNGGVDFGDFLVLSGNFGKEAELDENAPDGQFLQGPASLILPAFADSGDVDVVARVYDKDGGFREFRQTLIVNNVSPKLVEVESATDPNTKTVTVTGSFGLDAGMNDTHTATINWGDNCATRTSLNGRLQGCLLTGGTGYEQDPDKRAVDVIGGSGSGMTVAIRTDDEGMITSTTIAEFGEGYQAGDVVTLKRGDTAGDAQIRLIAAGTLDQDARTFTAAYTYLQNPTAEVEVSVTDDDGGSDTLTVSGGGIPGDFDNDGDLTPNDIDLIFDAIESGATQPIFDLNEDGSVTSSDADYLIGRILNTRRGDVNLDEKVNFGDFLIVSGNFGGDGRWATGDFDGNSIVSFGDFLLLSGNFGFDSTVRPDHGFDVTMAVINNTGIGAELNSVTEAIDAFRGVGFGIESRSTEIAPVINYGGGPGDYDGTRPYPNGISETEDLSEFVVFAEAIVTIPVGNWTIGFGSDDGGFVRLDGVEFFGEDHSPNNRGIDIPGDDEIRHEGLRGHRWTSGQFTVTGTPLTTTLEALMFEHQLLDSFELAILEGHGNNLDVKDDGTLLSDRVLGWEVTTPVRGFDVTMVVVNDLGTDTEIDTATEAEAALRGVGFGIESRSTEVAPVINYGGGQGDYGQSRAYPNGTSDTEELSEFVVYAEAMVTIPQGDWTIGIGSDDGGFLRLDGVNFFGEDHSPNNPGPDIPGDDEIRHEGLRGHRWTSGQFTVSDGPQTVRLEALMFDHQLLDSFELAILDGLGNNLDVKNEGTLLSNGALGWELMAFPSNAVTQPVRAVAAAPSLQTQEERTAASVDALLAVYEDVLELDELEF